MILRKKNCRKLYFQEINFLGKKSEKNICVREVGPPDPGRFWIESH